MRSNETNGCSSWASLVTSGQTLEALHDFLRGAREWGSGRRLLSKRQPFVRFAPSRRSALLGCERWSRGVSPNSRCGELRPSGARARRARSRPPQRRSATRRRPASGSPRQRHTRRGSRRAALPARLRARSSRARVEVDVHERHRAARVERDLTTGALVPRRRAAPGRSHLRSHAAPSARAGRHNPRRARRPPRTRRRSGSACRRCPGRRAARARGTSSARRRGRSARRKTPITRGGCGSVETPASSSASTFSPAIEQVDGLDPGSERRVAEILALAREEAGLFALLLALQRADELEPRIVLRGDHAVSPSKNTSTIGASATRSSNAASPRYQSFQA